MQLETFGPGMPSESLPDRQATHQQVRREQSSKIYTFKKVGVRQREFWAPESDPACVQLA